MEVDVGIIHNLGAANYLSELHDTGLEQSLSVFGGAVLVVFAQVTKAFGSANILRYLAASAGF